MVTTITYMVIAVVKIFQTGEAHGAKQQIKPQYIEGTMTQWSAINRHLCQFGTVEL
jgi:hypothetical protein